MLINIDILGINELFEYYFSVCADGKYGANCQSTCAHCAVGQICDKKTGECPSPPGCVAGYDGTKCDTGVNYSLVVNPNQINLLKHCWYARRCGFNIASYLQVKY